MAKLIFAVVFATLVVSSLAVPVDNNGAEGQPETKSRLIKLQLPLGARTTLEKSYFISPYNDKLSFAQAVLACKDSEMRLVTLKTASKRSDIQSVLRYYGITDEVWIGLSDIDRELEWKWIDDTPLRLSNWDPHSGNSPDYDCASLCPENSFYWFHRKCATAFRYVCEEP